MRFANKQYDCICELRNKQLGAPGMNEVIAVHSDFAKTAYKNFVAQAGKLNAPYSELTKEVLKAGIQETARPTYETVSERTSPP